MSTPPAHFANDKCYGSKSKVFGPRNKMRHEWVMNKAHCKATSTNDIDYDCQLVYPNIWSPYHITSH